MANGAPSVIAAKPAAKQSIAEIIKKWSEELLPANADKTTGPLAWVRNTKVPELIEALKKGGY